MESRRNKQTQLDKQSKKKVIDCYFTYPLALLPECPFQQAALTPISVVNLVGFSHVHSLVGFPAAISEREKDSASTKILQLKRFQCLIVRTVMSHNRIGHCASSLLTIDRISDFQS